MNIVAHTIFPKKLFTCRKARTGKKAASEPMSVLHGSCLWQSIEAFAYLSVSPTRHRTLVFQMQS